VGGYEILEHTADLGIRAWGDTLEEAFEQAAWGLLDTIGVRRAGPGEQRTIPAAGSDHASLLVDFLNELIFLQETEAVGFADVRVRRLTSSELEAGAEVMPLGDPADGVQVKAATYHLMEVRTDPPEARVYLDV
jgi:SHS2 domain-containing protein